MAHNACNCEITNPCSVSTAVSGILTSARGLVQSLYAALKA